MCVCVSEREVQSLFWPVSHVSNTTHTAPGASKGSLSHVQQAGSTLAPLAQSVTTQSAHVSSFDSIRNPAFATTTSLGIFFFCQLKVPYWLRTRAARFARMQRYRLGERLRAKRRADRDLGVEPPISHVSGSTYLVCPQVPACLVVHTLKRESK